MLPPRRQGDRGFAPVDLVAQADDPEYAESGVAEVVSTLSRAAEAGGTVAIQGFATQHQDRRPLTFVLAISLADVPYPEASELPDGNVTPFEIPCGAGVRVQRLAQTPTSPGKELLEFTATYLAQTDYGLLALAFATPHVDGAPEFSLLFDYIASSCKIDGAQSPPSAT